MRRRSLVRSTVVVLATILSLTLALTVVASGMSAVV